MNAKDADVLINTIKSLVVADDSKPREVVAQGPTGAKLVRPGGGQMPPPRAGDEDLERIFQYIKRRLSEETPTLGSSGPQELERTYQYIYRRFVDDAAVDPILLKIITQQPELIIEGLEPRRVTIDGNTLRGRIARLIASGFFDTSKTQGACRTELRRTGADANSGSISTIFNDYVKDGFFHRDGEAYVKAPGLKITQTTVETQ